MLNLRNKRESTYFIRIEKGLIKQGKRYRFYKVFYLSNFSCHFTLNSLVAATSALLSYCHGIIQIFTNDYIEHEFNQLIDWWMSGFLKGRNVYLINQQVSTKMNVKKLTMRSSLCSNSCCGVFSGVKFSQFSSIKNLQPRVKWKTNVIKYVGAFIATIRHMFVSLIHF